MLPVLAIRHVPHEGLEAIAPSLERAGLRIEYVDFFEAVPTNIDPADAAGLVALGGPMNVDETDRFPYLQSSVEWIQRAMSADVPVLGVCLGSQLLAKSLGARVAPLGVQEIGWYDIELTAAAADDALFAELSPRQRVFQWHGDTFELPEGAVHLASSRQCANQAFRYGRNAYGLQFHLEVTDRTIDAWLREPGNACQVARLDYIDEGAIRRATPVELPGLYSLGGKVWDRFAQLCRQHAT